MATGKDICNQLRKIRVEIAKRNDERTTKEESSAI